MKKAVVLLSGGLDSTTCLYWARKKGYKTFALLFDYGQRHRKEILCARRIAEMCHTPYHVVRFALPWGKNALVGRSVHLPKGRQPEEMVTGAIPPTYVPARNTLFLSFALSYADAVGPACRPRYIQAMRNVALLGTKSGVEGKKIEILAPLIRMSKSQIVRLGARLGVPFNKTWSCYAGGRRPCGQCDSCVLREKGFQESGFGLKILKEKR
ncbi:MAG: 7-cyano-7-deazaguanine synthase QueC [Elusimicrobia bacterium]|nr:7-cyano-7-deazaguanine synthase QueC [Elusimicrobiota bacterium]